jgi:uncharacterized phage protein gp47/JayE
MTDLPTQSFDTIVANIAAGIQGRAQKLLNFKTGSTLRAIAEGYAGIFLWWQALVLQLLTACRLSTASGNDVDTFTADFMPAVAGTNSPRLPANNASGQVTVSRLTAGPNSVFVPVGAIFTVGDGSANNFVVIPDPTYPSFNVLANGYVLDPAVASMIIPVQCVTPGTQGNVSIGSINQIVSNITGIDQVTNAANFVNGIDAESDAALKSRFAAYIMGLSRGDLYGTAASLESVGVSVQWDLTEGYNYDGSWRGGYYWIVADDGSGSPPPSFLQSIMDAAQAVRPLGIQCAVFPPVILWATISFNVFYAKGYDGPTIAAAVAANVTANVNGLGLGNDLEWSQISTWVYAIPGVRKVENIILNGLTGDGSTLVTSKPTLDGTMMMPYATVKIKSVLVTPLLISTWTPV